MPERSSKYQPPPPPPHRRKTPSFSSSLLDSILRSIDETNDGDDQLQRQQQQQVHDHDLMFFASDEPKRNEPEQMPSLRRAIMIDQWMESHSSNINRNRNGYVSRKVSSDSSSSGTTTFTTSSSSETETPSTYRSLPNSFTISREPDHTQNPKQREGKFMKSTKLRAMKIYGDLKKVKQQPMSPGSRISAFIHSLFASSSSKKAKIQESMHNFRSRSTKKQDTTMTCTSFSRSCMSKKQQHSSSVKRSVRFYPDENDTVILDRKSTQPLPTYERRWFTEKNYTKNYNNFVVNVEEDDEDDLFELEIVAAGVYRQELPVFETTDLRKIRII